MSQQVHWNEGEIILPAEVPRQGELIAFAVPIALMERRLYLYMEVAQSATAPFQLRAGVVGMKGGRPVAEIPANIADLSTTPQSRSVGTLFNAGGSPVGDSYVLRFAQPFVSGINSVTIQPLRINAEIDRLTFRVFGLTGQNLTGFRAFLGCLSTKY